jgi:RimJ/RimL family protein N-acetyltransferase
MDRRGQAPDIRVSDTATLQPVDIVLETERLVLRQWSLADFDDFAAMSADPQVMQFLAVDGKPDSRFGSWRSLCGMVGHWQLRGFGMFAVIERATGAFVGRAGPWQPEEWPDFEIGWALRSEYWGRGYATEAAKRCIAYAFTELERSHISSFIAPENTRSIRVAERAGERFEGEIALPHVPDRPHLQYGLSRDDWQQRTRPT